MSWGGLNPALTAWRNGINARFPDRDTTTDGARADKAHGSTSQHQEDADGTVDAFDNDVNFLRSNTTTGSLQERQIVEALKRDFESDYRSQLWIHDREIANRDIDGWRERAYAGPSPHDHHVHWQSRQSREDDGSSWNFAHTDALLALWREDNEVAFKDEKIPVSLTTGAELFEPDIEPGTLVPAATILSLAAVWARRAALSTDTLERRLTAMETDIAAIKTAVTGGAS